MLCICLAYAMPAATSRAYWSRLHVRLWLVAEAGERVQAAMKAAAYCNSCGGQAQRLLGCM